MKISWPYLIITIILALYLIIFYSSPDWGKEAKDLPYTIQPMCKNKALPISLTTNNDTICIRNKSVFMNIDNSEYEIYSLNDDELLFTVTPQVIVTTLSNMINLSLYSDKGEIIETKQIELKQNEYLSSFFYNSSDLYLSTIIEVDNPDKMKTRIFKVKLSKGDKRSEIIEISKKEFIDMYSIADMKNDILSLKEPFSFLEAYTKYYDWNNSSFITPNNAETIYDINLIISNNKLKILNRNGDTILEETTALSNKIKPLGYTGTKNDKTVYNCKDFSESLEITLRACIPNNETTN